ncbi:MAG TPA: SusE domain-containing protein [Parafilimonas sp.]|nr:SusE domain-containing protein [Parafilimonas sp.]
MKKYLNKLATITAVTLLFASCKKEGTDVTYTGGTAPVLSSTAGDSIALSSDTKDNEAVTFKWTNPNYTFSNGISSLNVTYNLEFDSAGANFSSPNKQTIQISPDLSKSFTVGDLNSLIANKLQLAADVTHTIEVRVSSLISPYTSGSANIAQLTSNVISFKATPYSPPPVIAPPASGTLFLVGGDPKIGAWSNPVPESQQFTQVTPTDYQLTIDLSGGDPTNSNASDQYLIIPVNGSWSHKYACNNTSTQPFSGGTFGLDLSSNFPGPTAAGTYKIDVNFQSGIITVTKQ